MIALALVVLVAGCDATVGGYEEEARPAPRGQLGTYNAPGGGANKCCVWIDLDKTLNTVGAFGYPFNPVPADELCKLLAAKKPQTVSTFLTARKGCLPAFKPGEGSCQQLRDTVSVACSLSKSKMAAAKQHHMAGRAECGAHILIDDNKEGANIKLAVPYAYVEPRAFAWAAVRKQILDEVNKCQAAAQGPKPGPGQPGNTPPPPGPGSCQGQCGKQAPAGCWCDNKCRAMGDCCADAGGRCGV